MKQLFIALTMLALSGPAIAQSDPITTAKRASQMLEAAADSLTEAESASDRVGALTETVRAYEEGLSALREGLRRASIQERSIALVFEAKRDRLARLLGILQTIGTSPAPLLMMHPTGAIGTARSGMILSEVTPALQSEALVLRGQLEEIRDIRSLQQSAATQLTKSLAEVQTARADLSKAIADRVELPRSFTSDSDKMRALIESSDTLQGFASGLTDLNPSDLNNPADFEAAKGNLTLPAAGTLLHGFNETDASGINRPGLVLATRAQSLVTTPWPATLRYSGPLLDYGNVVILEPSKGYLLILAGLGQTFGEVGEVLDQGAPVGLMGGLTPNPDAFLMTAAKGGGGNQQESLYIELRQGDEPVDPATWFATNKE
ncbi:Septal ring factor EnvC, activator of murein hydrolases AmiA and AmiB [Litoreibacter ascidiaceicola]|uniref:Septal ring factor EnvC, activator of murein hydrolases AmiA and AmiB n=1 Tax=Litoreibacter ascidiaceicola TaxID=1486859 RepID=A0A1M5B9A6_9RHOB|nr:peptidoglycan DD-metalloendopeptidase family protein [Litoreibacter ascidiaceicola]SHF39094.1 Septal ring factor EnvC, activator of murein hydrolases AmiA and AmiB [Litoreibacter ascidiaceicola]